MKIKKFAALLAAAVCILCLGIFASACTNDSATEFTVTVYYSDGTTVVDGTKEAYQVQICVKDGFCYEKVPVVDANGKATFKIADVDAAAKQSGLTYEVHVIPPDDYEATELTANVTVNKNNPTVKAVLKNVAAPAK